MRAWLVGLLLIPAVAPKVVAPTGTMPFVRARALGSPGSVRATIDCGQPDATIDLDRKLTPFGGAPKTSRAFVATLDGTATCSNASTHGAVRLAPLKLASVVPGVVDKPERHVVVTVEGSGLAPTASDDGVYLVWSGAVERLSSACREASATESRLVACASPSRNLGPARVRVQSAGRLAESPVAIDLGALLGKPR